MNFPRNDFHDVVHGAAKVVADLGEDFDLDGLVLAELRHGVGGNTCFFAQAGFVDALIDHQFPQFVI